LAAFPDPSYATRKRQPPRAPLEAGAGELLKESVCRKLLLNRSVATQAVTHRNTPPVILVHVFRRPPEPAMESIDRFVNAA
jgi:hypothetical protein